MALALCSLSLVTALAWLTGEVLTEFDAGLIAILSSASGFSASSTSNAWIRLLLDIVFAVAAIFVGLKLEGKSRLIAGLQILVISIVLQVVCLHLFAIEASPISLFLAASTGVFAGAGLRWYRNTRERMDSQSQEIAIRNEELIRSQLQLIREDEIERRVLAGDLHDQVLNDLKAVRQRLQSLREAKDASSKDRLAAEVDELLSASMTGIRDVMDNLSPAVLEHLGFVEAVEDILRKGAEKSGYKVRFKSELGPEDFNHLSSTELTMIYRIVQESVNNIRKHSGAAKVRCLIGRRDGHIHITIADDGVGLGDNAVGNGSRGLEYMQQRASILGARVSLRPAEKGKGTVVDICL
ncbi:MAG: sensor histidine kinase [Candidatus Obscuribacterales bacterium]